MIVPEEFLLKYRKFAERYAYHDRDCNMHPQNMSSIYDFCDCGYSDTIKELQRLQVEIKPNE